MMRQAEQGALHGVAGIYLIAQAVLFRRALGSDDPVAAAGLLLALSAAPGLYLLAAGIQWLRGRASLRFIRGGAKALVAFGVTTAALYVALIPSLDFALRLARQGTPTPLLVLWCAPPTVTLLMGILGLAAGRQGEEGRIGAARR